MYLQLYNFLSTLFPVSMIFRFLPLYTSSMSNTDPGCFSPDILEIFVFSPFIRGLSLLTLAKLFVFCSFVAHHTLLWPSATTKQAFQSFSAGFARSTRPTYHIPATNKCPYHLRTQTPLSLDRESISEPRSPATVVLCPRLCNCSCSRETSISASATLVCASTLSRSLYSMVTVGLSMAAVRII